MSVDPIPPPPAAESPSETDIGRLEPSGVIKASFPFHRNVVLKSESSVTILIFLHSLYFARLVEVAITKSGPSPLPRTESYHIPEEIPAFSNLNVHSRYKFLRGQM